MTTHAIRNTAATALCVALLSLGCASQRSAVSHYQPGQGWLKRDAAQFASIDDSPNIEVVTGRPNKVVDGIGWIVGIPSKLMLWDRRANNHQVSPETTAAIAQYAESNQIEDLCIRVNQYDPAGEWQRLTQNDQVGAGWRYTVGTLSWLRYTILPGRVFGGERYNPYTNSLYVYSDIPALGIQTAAYGKDVQSRPLPGTYAVANEFPFVSLWHESVNTRDALAYSTATLPANEQAEARRILHPLYGSKVGGALDDVLGVGLAFQIGGAIVGHITGRMQPMDEVATLQKENQPASGSDEDGWVELASHSSKSSRSEDDASFVHPITIRSQGGRR